MRQEPDNKPSYAFGGPVNTTASGNPVPCFMATGNGGAIISAGIMQKISNKPNHVLQAT
ncbi:lambda tail assembly I [Enterobacter hormaechei]|nr:lambda tail assembly I [Enterobacter hormaechei]